MKMEVFNMKKVSELLKPYLSIIFGALLFLIYFNSLQYQGEALALGIIAVILAAYYVARGIIGIIIGDKMPQKLTLVLDILSVCLFALFMFVETLLTVVELHKIAALENVPVAMGPTAWTIAICNMAAALGLIGFYIVSKFVKAKVVARFAMMFGAIFVLSLILNILFESNGAPVALGDILVPVLLLYVTYTVMLFNSFSKAEKIEEKAE